MKRYFVNVDKFKKYGQTEEDPPFGVHHGEPDMYKENFMMFYIDNEAWGSEAHIHLLTFVKQVILQDLSKQIQDAEQLHRIRTSLSNKPWLNPDA